MCGVAGSVFRDDRVGDQSGRTVYAMWCSIAVVLAMSTKLAPDEFDRGNVTATHTWHFDTANIPVAGQSMSLHHAPNVVADTFGVCDPDLANPEKVTITTSANGRPFAISLFATDKRSPETGSVIPTGIRLNHSQTMQVQFKRFGAGVCASVCSQGGSLAGPRDSFCSDGAHWKLHWDDAHDTCFYDCSRPRV